MRKLFLVMIVAAMFFACQPKTQTVPVDTAAAKVEVNSLMDKYLTAWNAKDATTLSTLLTEDGLFCGTDPTELMNKKMTSDAWIQAFSDTSTNYSYSVEKREIRITSDGNSAIAMEQFTMKAISPKMPCRIVNHAVKTADGWKIDFISWSLIPKNEDIAKLNKAVE